MPTNYRGKLSAPVGTATAQGNAWWHRTAAWLNRLDRLLPGHVAKLTCAVTRMRGQIDEGPTEKREAQPAPTPRSGAYGRKFRRLCVRTGFAARSELGGVRNRSIAA